MVYRCVQTQTILSFIILLFRLLDLDTRSNQKIKEDLHYTNNLNTLKPFYFSLCFYNNETKPRTNGNNGFLLFSTLFFFCNSVKISRTGVKRSPNTYIIHIIPYINHFYTRYNFHKILVIFVL